MSTISRRGLLKLSSLSAGSLLFCNYSALASSLIGKKDLLCEMIYKNVAGSIENKEHVENFIEQLLTKKLDLLEDEDFVDKELGRYDQHKLERFLVTQYLTTTDFMLDK